jgi:ABC-type lipoprotein release transport system permease subunit
MRASLEVVLAWRNVWRNSRRTGLTVTATVFAVVLVVFFVAFAAGVHEKMIEDSVRVHSGHLSISGEGYLENRTLEEFIHFDTDARRMLEETAGVYGFAPRVASFALASFGDSTRGVAVLGVDPVLEPTVSTLQRRVKRGTFVNGVSRGVVLGERLARSLSADLGDEVLLYSVAYSLETAYDLFQVVGIAKLPDPLLDRTLAIITLSDAQAFYAYGDRVSEIAVLATDSDAAGPLAAVLGAALANGSMTAEVHTWRESMPELEQFIILDDAGMYVLLAILVIVVAFGIFNTILMSVLERKREFGVMLALGMRPRALFRLVYLESLLLAVVGLVIGLGLGLAIVLYFQANPIEITAVELVQAMEMIGAEPLLTWKLKLMNPVGSVLTVLCVAILAALYPAIVASHGRPVDVLRSL